jgi:chaperone modulatory protein CbpM
MSQPAHSNCELVEEEIHLTLIELSQTCKVSEDLIVSWVIEGVLEPVGQQPQEWRFGGSSLRRARLAQQLTEDMELNTPGVALALDLLEQIAMLKAQLKRSSHY